MAKLKFFDCNCSVGRVVHPQLNDSFEAADLRHEMDIAGVEEALVFHTMARDAGPSLGNGLLGEALRGVKGLHSAWVVLPHHTGEMPPPKKLLKEMAKNGVKAVRMYPTKDYHSFSLAEWSCGKLLSALEEARVPLMLDIEIVWWEAVQSILERHPKLPLIVTNVGYRHNRFSYPLFDRYDNLYVETSRYYGAGNFEDVVERFGNHKIVFGTNMPLLTGTAAVSMLTYADIPAKAKEAIAGGTLRKLLKEALS